MMDLSKLNGTVFNGNKTVESAEVSGKDIAINKNVAGSKCVSLKWLVEHNKIVLSPELLKEVKETLTELSKEEKAKEVANLAAAAAQRQQKIDAHNAAVNKAKELLSAGADIASVVSETGLTEEEVKKIYDGVFPGKKPLGTIRIKGHNLVYWLFQGDHYPEESSGNYIFAPIFNKTGKTEPHYYERLTQLCPGDIIFHAMDGYIKAISVVESKYEYVDHDIYTMEEKGCRKVSTKYYELKKPVKHSDFKTDIIRICKDLTYAPFNDKGKGNEGYLFELPYELAKIFLNEIIANNSEVGTLPPAKEILSL